ncbi:MAG: hypothetical protein JXC32_14695 [Anaerolineae bacterium]|nr:hypothetical protein [Anaerolineae bacterium]
MKILITYYSLTGKTAQVAAALREALASQGMETTLAELNAIAAASLSDCDLVFLGSPCHDTDLAKPVKQFLDEIGFAPGFKLAGFVTHATRMPDEDALARELYETWAGNCIRTLQRICQEKQIAFLGYFHCQGAPSPPIEAFIHNAILTDEAEWQTYVEEVRHHPDEADLGAAQRFALDVLDRCRRA